MTIRVIIGDALEQLRLMPDESMHCCVTSPPYYGLRDYSVAGQIGLEPSPAEYVAALVAVFGEVRRVLRRDGTLWVVIGDSYASSIGFTGRNDTDRETPGGRGGSFRGGERTAVPRYSGCKPKDLIGIPWMLAFALRADGWWLRQDIIWAKPNPMPESVTDRCTKGHEYLFMLSKSARYFYDGDAIKEPCAEITLSDKRVGSERLADFDRATQNFGAGTSASRRQARNAVGSTDRRNRRSVWTVPSEASGEAHFATFPPALIEPCILAGCPKGGTVLDAFSGAGTTGLVADRLGRDAVLIELNPAYATMARRRIEDDAGLFAQVEAAE